MSTPKEITSIDSNSLNLDMIVVQAFPANENLSSGMIKYLGEFFNVHFINLPGFHEKEPRLESITFDSLSAFVEKKIESLGLDEYILAGISFGYLLANSINVDRRKVLALMGFGPYLGYDYLGVSDTKRMFNLFLINAILFLRLQNFIWNRWFFRSQLKGFLGGKSGDIVNSIIEETDPTTFFKTAKIALSYDRKPVFHKLPYIVFMNPKDKAIDFDKTFGEFSRNVDEKYLKLIVTKIPHYPESPSYEYFKKNITHNEIESFFNFVAHLRSMDDNP